MRKTMAEVIREELRKGSYQMPGDKLPYETQASGIAAALAAAGFGELNRAAMLGATMAYEAIEESALTEARADALEEAALEFEIEPRSPRAKMARYFNNAYIERLRARARDIRCEA